MNSMCAPLPIKLLGHDDFIKVRLYHIESAMHGTFPERVAQFNNDIQSHIDVYGRCPREIYDEKRKYVKEWYSPWKNSAFIRVDVTTGEVDEPCK